MHCVPPERHPGCQDHCEHYKEARARYDADKAIRDRTKSVKDYINDNINRSMDGVVKYKKRRPKNGYRK
jgi:hypothetical protein